MSEFQSALTWLRNGEVQLLFFVLGLNDGEDLESVIPESIRPNCQLFDYRGDGPFPVLLFEWRGREEFSLCRTKRLIEEMFSRLENKSFAVICMFDGAFLNSEDLLAEENVEQIFAFQFNGETRLALRDELRHSDAWKEAVRRMQLGARKNYNA